MSAYALLRRITASALLGMGLGGLALAQSSASDGSPTRENLMAVLRESGGANKPDAVLTPVGKMKAKLPDGRELEIEMAHFAYIGDMHVRFVFDGPRTMRNATPQDLAKLGLDANAALRVAVDNIKRVYGAPQSSAWSGALMQVRGKSPDLDSSYFLDQAFWTGLTNKHPEGVVVAVPKRGGLLYVPVSDEKTVDQLRRGIAGLYASSGSQRVSSALYLFKDGSWSVFQAPLKP